MAYVLKSLKALEIELFDENPKISDISFAKTTV